MPGQPDFDATNGDEGVVMDEAASEVSEPTDEVVKAVNTERARRASTAACEHRGPSALWDDDQEWILIFDRLLNEPSGRGCQPGAPSSARSTRTEAGSEPTDEAATRAASVVWSTSFSTSRRPLLRKVSDGGESSAGAGAIDEATFIASFERVPRLHIFSSKDLEAIMTNLRETMDKQSNDWSVRTDALKKLRGVLMAGGADFDDLYRHLRLMEPALQLTVQDLRSQVVREGCITIAYLSQQLGHRVDHVCYSLLPYLIELIPNSAKVMSTSGVVAIRFIIHNTHYAKLVPIVTGQLSSKSREIRRACCEFLEHMISSWPTHVLEKHVASVREALRRGVTDADAEVRTTSRRAYWGFANHFREQADSLLDSLDSQHKKLLSGGMSRSGSNSSLSVRGRSSLGAPRPRCRASSRSGSQEKLAGASGLSRTGSLSRRPTLPQPSPAPGPDRGKSLTHPAVRSTSAIDLQAVQRAHVRAQYAAAQRAGTGGGPASLIRPQSATATTGTAPSAAAAPGRHRSRSVTQSQPGSRSSSPSSRISYVTYTDSGSTRSGPSAKTQTLGRHRHLSGIPHSSGPSCETSPQRQLSDTGLRRPALNAMGRPLTAHKRLQQTRDAESAQTDVLAPGRLLRSRGRAEELSNGSRSEAGSVSSGRSSLEAALPKDDVGEVLRQMASTQWSERHEGLLALRAVLRSNRMLTASELNRVTELFTKMFMDKRTKVFGLFLVSVEELVVHHCDDLADWLRVLIARLLTKQGTDLLGSVVKKIEHTLDVVRTSFPASEQLCCLCHFLLDHHHTPNTRVRAASLRYLHTLLEGMGPVELAGADPDLPLVVTKVLVWASDQKSAETRNAAKAVIVALFDLSTAEFTHILQQLPKMDQDSATDIIQQHLRRRATTDQSAARPQVRSPSTANCGPLSALGDEDLQASSDRTNTENLGQEGSERARHPATSERRHQRDSTSLDSGGSRESHDSGRSPLPADEEEQLAAVLADLDSEAPSDRRRALQTVCRLTKVGSERLLAEHFSTLLHLLLDSLRDGGGAAREPALTALTEMLHRQPVAALLAPFSELVFLRVLDAQRVPAEREVARAAEQCAATLAARLPANVTLTTLARLVQAGEFPINKAAINTLTKLVELRSPQTVQPWLPDLIPVLLKAYDNSESSVRKAAVFCIVTLHTVCGESVVEPHLLSLNPTKMKLLRMYIRRAQSGDLPGDSPRGDPSSPQ